MEFAESYNFRQEILMRKHRVLNVLRLVCVLSFLAVVTLGCGSMNSTPNRVLQSVAVSPTGADAQNFPQAQVQFAATGTFSRPPSPAPVPVPFVAPYSGSWISSNLNIATVNQSGVAQCVAGTSGTVTITALVSSNSGMGTQMSTGVSGTAKLTCP